MSSGYIPTFNTGGNAEPADSLTSLASEPGFLAGNSGGNSERSGGNSGADDGFDPTIHVSRDKRNADGSYTKKRGRRSNGGSNSASGKKANNSVGVDALTETLLIIHAGVASLSGISEIALERDDSERLSQATVNVLNEFDITPSPKAQAIIGLIATAGMIYGPKYYLYRTRIKEEKENEQT